MIKAKLPGSVVLVTEGELLTMLQAFPEIHEKALRRGKHERRAAILAKRERRRREEERLREWNW